MSVFSFEDILAEASKRSGGSDKESVRLSGIFNLEVAYAMAKKSKSGNPMLSLKWIVLDGPNVGEESWQNVTLTDKSRGMFGRTLLELGFTPDYLRSLASADDTAFMASLEAIAESVVGVRIKAIVSPNVKNPEFDDWKIDELVEGPDSEKAPTLAGPVIPGAPVNVIPPSVAHAAPQPVPAAPGQIPGGGFVPQLTNVPQG